MAGLLVFYLRVSLDSFIDSWLLHWVNSLGFNRGIFAKLGARCGA